MRSLRSRSILKILPWNPSPARGAGSAGAPAGAATAIVTRTAAAIRLDREIFTIRD